MSGPALSLSRPAPTSERSTAMKAVFDFLIMILRNVSVEPVLMLVGIASNMVIVIDETGMYRVICDQMFNANGGTDLNNRSSFECWDTSRSLGDGMDTNDTKWWREAENILQQRTSSYSIVLSMFTLPGVVAGAILSAYSDRRGRKGIMIIGLCGAAAFVIPSVILYSAPRTTPLYVSYIVYGIFGFCGSSAGVMIASIAYYRDTVAKEKLTMRIGIMQGCQVLGVVVGPLMANALLNAFGYVCASITAMAVYGLAIATATVTVKWVKPGSLEKSEMPVEDSDGHALKLDEESNDVGFLNAAREAVVDAPRLIIESLKAISRPRPAHKRAYLLSIVCVGLLAGAMQASLTGKVFGLFVQREPFNWTASEISYFRSTASLMQVFGAVVGILLLQKRFRLSDTFVLMLAILSLGAEAFMLAGSQATWMLYVAFSAGAFSSLLIPCAESFVSKIVGPNEVGKVNGAVSVLTTFVVLFSSIGIPVVYQGTVAWYPGLVFLILAVIAALAFMITLCVHLDQYYADAVLRCLKRMGGGWDSDRSDDTKMTRC